MSLTSDFEGQAVWIIDDRPPNGWEYRDLVEVQVRCATDYSRSKKEALDRLDSGFAPSVVLLDVQLPAAEDGLEVCRAIKQGKLRPEMQVVMITASEERDLLRRCLDAGADDFARRSSTPEEKVARIRSKLHAQRAQTELLQSYQEIGRREAIVEFADGLHHDVNNALPEIRDHLVGITVPEELQWILNETQEGITHVRLLCGLLKQLFNSGGEETREEHAVVELLDEVFGTTHKRARPSQLTKDYNLSRETTLVGYRPNLFCTLTEMVFNARSILYVQRNKDPQWPFGEIWLGASAGPDWVELTIADNGPGVPEELGNNIFDRGVTRREKGSGLGLYLAKTRVERMGGTLNYRHKEPHGAVFTIRLPRGGDVAVGKSPDGPGRIATD